MSSSTAIGSKYERGPQLGEGTWGVVSVARIKSNPSQLVAIKKIKRLKNEDHGINFSALKEVKYLQELRHVNIIRLYDVFAVDGTLHLVLELCPFDLEAIIRDKMNVVLSPANVKSYMFMILNGVDYCHKNFVLHRDLKPGNLLIGSDHQVKIADFGLARSHGSPVPMSAGAITSWYRPPEMFFGSVKERGFNPSMKCFYGAAVDIWSVGCVFAELMLRTPFFGRKRLASEISILLKILSFY